MQETEKAYVAGFFDGEGCIYIGRIKSRNTYTITGRIIIGGTDKSIIDYVYNIIQNGRKNDTQHNRKPNWKKMFRIELSQLQGVKLLQDILPYLNLKKRQAELFIKLANLKRKSTRAGQYEIKRQEQIMEENRKLNKRGI